MKKHKFFFSIIILIFYNFARADEQIRIHFNPIILGIETTNDDLQFARYGLELNIEGTTQKPNLSKQEHEQLFRLIRSKDLLGVINKLEDDKQFAIYLLPSRHKQYELLAYDFFERFKACISAMPSKSGSNLFSVLSALKNSYFLTRAQEQEIREDFSKSVSNNCKESSNNNSYDDDALARIYSERMLLGQFLDDSRPSNNIRWILSNLNYELFASQNSIFSFVAYDYLNKTLSAVISEMKEDGFNQISRPHGFTTFIDFLTIAKTKTSMPPEVLDTISRNCFSNISDIFKPFNLNLCGHEFVKTTTFVHGQKTGKLISLSDHYE